MKNIMIVLVLILIFAGGICFAKDTILNPKVFPGKAKVTTFKSDKSGVNQQLPGTVLLNLRSDSLLWVEDFEDDVEIFSKYSSSSCARFFLSIGRARPKSETIPTLSWFTKTLVGLKSLCISPTRWAAASPRAASCITFTTSS